MGMRAFYKLIEKIYLEYRIRQSGSKVVYYIKVDNEIAGFFAILRRILDYCCYADEQGFLPYIVYSKKTLYAEKGLFLGTNNPFEYYYEQSSKLMPSILFKGLNVVESRIEHSDRINLQYNLKQFSYIVEDGYIEKMAYIYKKYMQLNAITKKRIEQSIANTLQGKYTLGVHIRGTDFNKGFNNHPVPVTVDEYIEVINQEIVEKQYEQIFIATDDARCLKEFKQKLKLSIPLVYYKNTMRGSGNKSVAYERNERKYNNYLLGLEVLQDAYTLSACGGLIGCLSQVDIIVQIMKKSRGQEFDFLNIIDKGIYVNNKQYWEPAK